MRLCNESVAKGMSQLIELLGVNQIIGRNSIALYRLEAERSQEEGWYEPYELRGSCTDLWGTGGEIPLVYPARR
jgi:hypothetical protein